MKKLTVVFMSALLALVLLFGTACGEDGKTTPTPTPPPTGSALPDAGDTLAGALAKLYEASGFTVGVTGNVTNRMPEGGGAKPVAATVSVQKTADGYRFGAESDGSRTLLYDGKMYRKGDNDDTYSCEVLPEDTVQTLKELAGQTVTTDMLEEFSAMLSGAVDNAKMTKDGDLYRFEYTLDGKDRLNAAVKYLTDNQDKTILQIIDMIVPGVGGVSGSDDLFEQLAVLFNENSTVETLVTTLNVVLAQQETSVKAIADTLTPMILEAAGLTQEQAVAALNEAGFPITIGQGQTLYDALFAAVKDVNLEEVLIPLLKDMGILSPTFDGGFAELLTAAKESLAGITLRDVVSGLMSAIEMPIDYDFLLALRFDAVRMSLVAKTDSANKMASLSLEGAIKLSMNTAPADSTPDYATMVDGEAQISLTFSGYDSTTVALDPDMEVYPYIATASPEEKLYEMMESDDINSVTIPYIASDDYTVTCKIVETTETDITELDIAVIGALDTTAQTVTIDKAKLTTFLTTHHINQINLLFQKDTATYPCNIPFVVQ